MKKIFVLFILLFCIIFSQQYEDVIYMKDGSIIKGLIIERVPNDYINFNNSNFFDLALPLKRIRTESI